MEHLYQREMQLARRFYEGVKDLTGPRFYGDYESETRTTVVSLNLRDLDAGQVSDWLWEDYEICVRAGAHCAPLMHQAFGTVEQGIVRFSFSHSNTEAEVDTAIQAVRELAE
jgi:selenocysteine lyase/cysteine desulfurase